MPWPTNPAEQYFGRGGWGWDGTQWRKLSLLWGYTDGYMEAKQDLSSPAVVGVLTFSTVPAGEVWRLTQWLGVDVQTACSNYILRVTRAAVSYNLSTVVPAAANDYKGTACDVVCKAGDIPSLAFVGTVLNDDLYGWLTGYKMAVT